MELVYAPTKDILSTIYTDRVNFAKGAAMKACVLHAVGDLRYEEVSLPEPTSGEVRVRVRACGVCGSDIPRIFTKGTYTFPTIPGHEFAGEVDAIGPDVDKALLGKRVAVFPLIPCQQCAPCKMGAYAQCEAYDYLGSRSNGAFAEYVCAPAWNLIPLPDAVSFEEAAMTEPAAVALHALRQAGVDLGDRVAIWGAGPIGVMLAQWAKTRGAANVFLADIDPEKRAFAHNLKLGEVCDPRENDPKSVIQQLTGGRGADVVIEASGSSAAFEQCMLAARTFGRVVLMGNPAGDMKLTQQAYWAILRNELKIFGTWNSSFAALPRNEWQVVLEAMAEGQFKVTPLITHRVSLDGLLEALIMMRDHTAFFSKVMFTA